MGKPYFVICYWSPRLGWKPYNDIAYGSFEVPYMVRWCEMMNRSIGPGLYNFKFCVKLFDSIVND